MKDMTNEVTKTRPHDHVKSYSKVLYNQNNPFATPVSVTFANQRRPDAEEMRRMGTRAINLNLLLRAVFDNSIAAMSVRLEIAPDRLRSLIEMQAAFDAEIAEHLERSLNLPGGWLDQRHTHIDAQQLRQLIFGHIESNESEESKGLPTVSASEQTETSEQTLSSAAAESCESMVEPLTTPSTTKQDDETLAPKLGDEIATPQNLELTRNEEAITQTLRWLNEKLDHLRTQEGVPVRTVLREQIGRAQSTISNWFNGMRRIPDDMLVPVVQAVIKAKLPVAEEFMERMFIAAPNIFTNEVRQSLRDLLKQHSSAQPVQVVSASVPTTVAAAPSITQAEGTTPPLSGVAHALVSLEQEVKKLKNKPSREEIELAIARAAEKIAEVLRQLLILFEKRS